MNINSNEYVMDILLNSGWNENRHVDINQWISHLKNSGYSPTDEVISCLSSLGGLKIKPPVNPEGAFYPDELIFDPLHPHCEFELVDYWSNRFGEKFCPIGIEGPRSTVVIGETGCYYSATDYGLFLLGHNLEECLDILIRAAQKPASVLLPPEQ